MKIITILNSKGGVGKSTILSNIIFQSNKMHYRVIYSDLDKQKSLSIWAKKKKNIKSIDSKKLDNKEILKNSNNDFLFIDSPASIKKRLLEMLIDLSSVIIVPTSDSNIEINACKLFLKKIRQFKKINKNKIKVIPIINRIRYSKNIFDTIIKSEQIIKENFGAWFPATKKFDEQMTKGSWIGDSSYRQKELVTEQLIRLIKAF